jgi:type II secretory pathway pseudopilin PulG
MIELLVVVAIIGILMGILLPTLAYVRKKGRESSARMAMNTIVSAIEGYRLDLLHYPPHDRPIGPGGSWGQPAAQPAGGSEVLYYYLCTKLTYGDMHYGPYLGNVGSERLKSPASGSPDKKQIISPLNGFYMYMVIKDPNIPLDQSNENYLVVDAGMDGKFGGEIDPVAGWQSDGSDANNDGILDDVDNIYSSPPVKK